MKEGFETKCGGSESVSEELILILRLELAFLFFFEKLIAAFLITLEPVFWDGLRVHVDEPLRHEAVDVHRVDHEDIADLLASLLVYLRCHYKTNDVHGRPDFPRLNRHLLFISRQTAHMHCYRSWCRAVPPDQLLQIKIAISHWWSRRLETVRYTGMGAVFTHCKNFKVVEHVVPFLSDLEVDRTINKNIDWRSDCRRSLHHDDWAVRREATALLEVFRINLLAPRVGVASIVHVE